MAAKTTVDWSGGPLEGRMNTTVDPFQLAPVDPNLEAMKKWMWENQQARQVQPRGIQRQAQALDYGYEQPMERVQAPVMQAEAPQERMVMIRKPAPPGYPASASGASHMVPESLLEAYLSQGWTL